MKTNNKIARVGIFMPAYNQGAYIAEAINSLKAQTFQDFELVIADDVSTDGTTPRILKQLSYEKISQIHFNKKNIGISKQTAKFAKKMKNEYFLILCADDKIAPNYIKECVDFLDKSPNIAAVATWIQYFGERDDIKQIQPEDIKFPNMLLTNNMLGSSLIRRQALADIGFSETKIEFKKHYDYDRWVSILEKDWQLAVIKKPLFFYRILSGSLSHSINPKDELLFQQAFIKKHPGLFKKYAGEVALYYIEKYLDSVSWSSKLQKNKDWLDLEYNKLLEENHYIKKHLFRFITSKLLKKVGYSRQALSKKVKPPKV